MAAVDSKKLGLSNVVNWLFCLHYVNALDVFYFVSIHCKSSTVLMLFVEQHQGCPVYEKSPLQKLLKKLP